MKAITEFQKYKIENRKISMVTCYDYWSASIINDSDIDAVLVGDSVAMVMHGYENTVNATVDMMVIHTMAVRRGLTNKVLIADMPFLAHKRSREFLIEATDKIFKAGAQAVKIEGAGDTLYDIEFLTNSGIPVMGHLGLTPQSVHKFGGFKLQGKENSEAEKLIQDAKQLERAGCFAIVLEMIPSFLAKEITDNLSIPTIGIGAGNATSGQILVLQDLLGLTKAFSPKFLRKYMNGFDEIKTALNNYVKDVKEIEFPSEVESY
ncbi:MAG: 3-methyl-2-oxobutanoate hydroxymethyltransferase [Ignavibacteria bacterium]|nr:MAG: 3-methyl-2-oxobutanoate hydroxymethyltransferase [Ignavibacteria bacterium]